MDAKVRSDVVIPETTPIARLLILIAARAGREGAMAGRLRDLARQIADASSQPVRAIGLVRRQPDPFAGGIGENRGFDSALDLRLESGGDVDALIAASAGLADWIAADAHVDLSHALAGPLHVLLRDDGAPIRYVYVMRRREDWSDADYLKHYVEHHQKFGLRTSGISGYSTHRIDPVASKRATAATGLGGWGASSVSELSIRDLDVFFREAMGSAVGDEAIADEERFVDRRNSVACCMNVVFDTKLR